jgi:NAD(P)-dependent dehydrogenase (short-subunit alcohol dehydrogenase family)
VPSPPGFIKTPKNDHCLSNPERLKVLGSAIALGRMGELIESATVMVFLAPDAASYVTEITVLAADDFLWRSLFK